jgi:ubiquinone/menaquinone biosynthesis C-methylase UbiE
MNTELFSGKAAAYAAARPGYPRAAIDYILDEIVPRRKNLVFADIGAGTGIFTRELALRSYENLRSPSETPPLRSLRVCSEIHRANCKFISEQTLNAGSKIFAVEPNADMLSQLSSLSAEFPNVEIISAPAEKTTLPDNSVDVITCAQALHWFDPVAFAAECRRIGKADSVIIAIYNNTPGGSSISYSKSSTEIFFENPTVREFANPIRYTREKWIAYMMSHSHDPIPSDPRFDAHIAEMNEIFDNENINGILHREVITKVYSEVTHGRTF